MCICINFFCLNTRYENRFFVGNWKKSHNVTHIYSVTTCQNGSFVWSTKVITRSYVEFIRMLSKISYRSLEQTVRIYKAQELWEQQRMLFARFLWKELSQYYLSTRVHTYNLHPREGLQRRGNVSSWLNCSERNFYRLLELDMSFQHWVRWNDIYLIHFWDSRR